MRKIVGFCFIVSLVFLSFNCSFHQDQKNELREKKRAEAEIFLKDFTDQHTLHTMRQANDQKNGLYAYFGIFGGQLSITEETEYNVVFSWKHPCNELYIFSSVPLSRTRVMITNDSLPLIKFKLKVNAIDEIIDLCVNTSRPFDPGIDLVSVVDMFNADTKGFIQKYVESLTISCRSEQWPTNISMPN